MRGKPVEKGRKSNLPKEMCPLALLIISQPLLTTTVQCVTLLQIDIAIIISPKPHLRARVSAYLFSLALQQRGPGLEGKRGRQTKGDSAHAPEGNFKEQSSL